MKISKCVKKPGFRVGYCQYPGCDREYWTTHNGTKFCDEHRLQADRPLIWKAQQAKLRQQDCNLHIAEPGVLAELVVRVCGLPGCDAKYSFRLIPRQHVYPLYCEAHRAEYRRILHTRRIKANG